MLVVLEDVDELVVVSATAVVLVVVAGTVVVERAAVVEVVVATTRAVVVVVAGAAVVVVATCPCTSTEPVIPAPAWNSQWYGTEPGATNVKANVPPGGTGWLNRPSSAVTVWARVLLLVHTTRSPGATVIVFGSKVTSPIPTCRSAAAANDASPATTAATTTTAPRAPAMRVRRTACTVVRAG